MKGYRAEIGILILLVGVLAVFASASILSAPGPLDAFDYIERAMRYPAGTAPLPDSLTLTAVPISVDVEGWVTLPQRATVLDRDVTTRFIDAKAVVSGGWTGPTRRARNATGDELLRAVVDLTGVAASARPDPAVAEELLALFGETAAPPIPVTFARRTPGLDTDGAPSGSSDVGRIVARYGGRTAEGQGTLSFSGPEGQLEIAPRRWLAYTDELGVVRWLADEDGIVALERGVPLDPDTTSTRFYLVSAADPRIVLAVYDVR